jgi:hypothetical protein
MDLEQYGAFLNTVLVNNFKHILLQEEKNFISFESQLRNS